VCVCLSMPRPFTQNLIPRNFLGLVIMVANVITEHISCPTLSWKLHENTGFVPRMFLAIHTVAECSLGVEMSVGGRADSAPLSRAVVNVGQCSGPSGRQIPRLNTLHCSHCPGPRSIASHSGHSVQRCSSNWCQFLSPLHNSSTA
jgi:hypothetical protein